LSKSISTFPWVTWVLLVCRYAWRTGHLWSTWPKGDRVRWTGLGFPVGSVGHGSGWTDGFYEVWMNMSRWTGVKTAGPVQGLDGSLKPLKCLNFNVVFSRNGI
uniref:Uncharacterized protein n=1 Tax=Sphaeramia orbicularis TaxID=375764 RepID=A0A672YFS6_9TELE